MLDRITEEIKQEAVSTAEYLATLNNVLTALGGINGNGASATTTTAPAKKRKKRGRPKKSEQVSQNPMTTEEILAAVAPVLGTTAPKRRGRPPGSKNKAKKA